MCPFVEETQHERTNELGSDIPHHGLDRMHEKHWRKAPDNRIVLNVDAIQRWMGGING
jgi:hypothetical protein